MNVSNMSWWRSTTLTVLIKRLQEGTSRDQYSELIEVNPNTFRLYDHNKISSAAKHLAGPRWNNVLTSRLGSKQKVDGDHWDINIHTCSPWNNNAIANFFKTGGAMIEIVGCSAAHFHACIEIHAAYRPSPATQCTATQLPGSSRNLVLSSLSQSSTI